MIVYEPSNIDEQQELSLTEKIKRKRNLIHKYMIDSESTDEDFNNIINEYGDDVPYTVNEAMGYVESNPEIFSKIINLMNENPYIYYDKKLGPYILQMAKNNNPHNFKFYKIFRQHKNPFRDDGVSDKEFWNVWNKLKEIYFDLKDDDMDLICDKYTFEEMKKEAGYNDDQVKSKVNEEDINSGIVDTFINIKDTPKTKGELFRYWDNLCRVYGFFEDEGKDIILGNINSRNANDSLSDIRVVFLSFKPSDEDNKYRTLLSNPKDLERIKLCIQGLQLTSKDYICLNICNISSFNINSENVLKIYSDVFSKVFSTLPKSVLIIPTDEIVYRKILGCKDDNSYYKYGKRFISSLLVVKNPNSINETSLWLNSSIKKPSVKRDHVLSDEDIITNIKYSNFLECKNDEIINNDDSNKNEIIESRISNIDISELTTFDSSHIYTLEEIKEELKRLKGYTITYISRSINLNKNKKYTKRGIPYLVLRKGKEKRFYYVDPEITIGVSVKRNYKIEEPKDNLFLYENIKFSNLYNSKRLIEKEIIESYHIKPVFYNTAFSSSVFISSYIRNNLKYKEGLDTPRIAVLDFETEKSAIKVKYDSETTNAKVRLISFLDVKYKVFYVGVLKDKKHKDLSDIANIKQHDGYEVNVNIFTQEIELWNWLNSIIYQVDPDIITGWNVDRFDFTYGITRCKNLGIELKSKYGKFRIIENIVKGKVTYGVGVDGIAIIDYKDLFEKCSQKKYENYKLEYICQEVLKKGKRPMLVNDHDIMYYDHLKEYMLYNIEDDERVIDLENKTSFLGFQFELCNVCNISWDEIFNKTKLIDGLIYNQGLIKHNALIKENNYGKGNQENVLSSILEGLQQLVIRDGIEYIDNGKISLKEYMMEIEELVKTSTDDEEEDEEDDDDEEEQYKGATVLLPQKGVYHIVADLDASQMYPRIMIRSNIFKDTLCAVILYKQEDMAEKWVYDREEFPSQIPIKLIDGGSERSCILTKEEFEEFLKDKIITPYGTIYYSPKVKRSLVSDILIWLIGNRNEYQKLAGEATEKYTKACELKGKDDPECIELDILRVKYINLQMAYKQLINSIYGAAATKGYKLNDPYSAASITACGRELTKVVAHFGSVYMDEMVKNKIEGIEFNSIPFDFKTVEGFDDIKNRRNALYGDTDSSMFWIGKIISGIYGNNISSDERVNHAWNIIRRTSRFINEYVIKNLLERKNIDFNDNDKDFNYSYKEEWVSEIVLFGTNKKQYAMHMVMNKGKRLDKIEVVGMTIKKSDTPRFAREFGSKIVEYILREYDSSDSAKSNKILIDKYNIATEEASRLMDEGNVVIAKPSSIKDITAYKTINSNQRGMLLYDLIFDHQYMVGDKGYQFDLESIDFEKLGISKYELKEKFKDTYHNCRWYEKFSKTCTDELLFSSITIPVDSEYLDTSIFKINKPKMIKTSLKSKIEKLYDIVGITYIDEDDKVKLRKTGIPKFSLDDPMFII